MATAPRDPNSVPSALLYDQDNTTTVTWKADSVTGRALIDIADSSPPTPTPFSATAQRDPNHVPSVMLLVDGTTDTLVPMMCDENGYPILDLTIE